MTDLEKIKKMEASAVCLHPREEMEAAVEKVAKAMNETFKDEGPLFLCTMNGGVIFMGQLVTKLNFPLQIDYVHTARYHGTMESGELSWIAKPRTNLKDRVVVIVEDIIDSGITLARVVDYCKEQGAKKVYTTALIDKKHIRDETGLKTVDFAGIEVEDKFLIGYGLDFDGFCRNLPGIYAVEE